MKLHQEWMTDNILLGADFTKNYELKLVKDRFDNQRYHSNEGFSLIVDGVTTQGVVQNHNNPMNDFKNYSYVFCSEDVNIKSGSYVIHKGDTYIVNDKVYDNLAYKSTIMAECDDDIVFKFASGIKSYPCVTSKATRMLGTVQTDKYIETMKMEFFVYVQANDDTMSIPPSARFLFKNTAYIVTDIDNMTVDGIIEFKIVSDLKRIGKDNFTTMLADQSVEIPQTVPTDLAINGSNSIKISTSSNYTILNNTNLNTFTWTIVDAISGGVTSYASISSSTLNSCNVKANLTSGKQIKLVATCIEVPTIVLSLVITISASL